MDRSRFLRPGSAERAVHLWMWNDALEPDEVRRQVCELARAGCGAVITRTYYGLRTTYLSEAYMEAMAAAIEEAARCGIAVYLQAGYMPNGFPGLPEPLRGSGLAARSLAGEPASGEPLAVDSDYAYIVQPFDHAIDLLNAAAVQAYVAEAYERVWQRFSRYFGTTVTSVWVDEPSFRPPLLPWSPELPERFRRLWGYDLLPHIPLLFHRRAESAKVRHHYWRTVVEMLSTGYFQTVAAWCAAHGLEFSGHLMGEDTLVDQIALTGAAMPLYQYMHLPGIDHLSSSLNWTHGAQGGEGGLPFILNPKQCTSVANQLGQPRALAEMYGVSTQALTLADQKRIGDYLALLGINQRCLHASFYSMRGRRKRLHAPNLSYQQPWWPHNGIGADYHARVSYLLRQGRYEPDILVLHPLESAFTCYEPLLYRFPLNQRLPMPDIERMNRHVVELSKHILDLGFGFDYGDESILAAHAKIAPDGALQVGEMRYRVVVLPELVTLRATTLALLRQFAAAGGTILATGALPSCVDGCADPAAGELVPLVWQVENSKAALCQALGSVLVPDGRAAAVQAGAGLDSVWVHRRTVDNGQLLFVLNPGDTAGAITVKVQPGMRLEKWDAQSGAVHTVPLADQEAQLPLAAWEALLLAVQANGTPVPAARPELESVEVITGAWQIKRISPNALTLDTCRFRQGDGELSQPMPVLAVQDLLTAQKYQGPVTLEFTFTALTVPRYLALVVEDADAWQIAVNGHACRYSGAAYYVDRSFLPVEVTEFVRPGVNTIAITRHFTPLERAAFTLSALFENLQGVELESVYLIGDFAVSAARSPREERAGCIRLGPNFALTDEPEATATDLTLAGYPFLAGTVALVKQVTLRRPQAGERVLLRLPHPEACTVELEVNGKSLGVRGLPPFAWEITDLIQGEELQVVLRVTNTLRNLLGPHHRPAGEPDNCWGEWAFKGYGTPGMKGAAAIKSWLAGETRETATWTDDYFVVPFTAGPVEVAYARGVADNRYRTTLMGV